MNRRPRPVSRRGKDRRLPTDLGDLKARESASARPRKAASVLSLGGIFRESLEIYGSHPVIVVPSVTLVILATVVTPLGLGSLASLPRLLVPASPEALGTGLSLGAILFALGSLIAFLLVEAMTIGLVREAYQGGGASVGGALVEALGKIGALIIAALLASVILTIGYLLLVIPGLILTFLLWFVVQAIMVDDEGGLGALRRSVEFFVSNAADAFIVVLASFGLLVVLDVMGAIPVLGWILLPAGMPYVIALPTVLYLDRA